MNARHLILTLSLALGAGAAVAAIKYGHTETAKAAPAVETTVTAIPRVVVTASGDRFAESPVARVVVVGRRADASRALAASN
ncbi:MAG: hypothetical protein A3I65_07735 [Betaproteobacteria bacterium RIFCSPLOWO2_02_FULL_68_150]|nr:MAG: hypothetical protein A3I65_07735 [Betaproteobacteria bacterium RIFCSPLOWO2_02_FULL_68_150]